MTPTLLAAYFEQRLTPMAEDLVIDHWATCTICGDATLYLVGEARSWHDFLKRYGEKLEFNTASESERCPSE